MALHCKKKEKCRNGGELWFGDICNLYTLVLTHLPINIY